MPTLAPPQIWSRKLRLLPSSRSRVYIATLVLLAVPITLMPILCLLSSLTNSLRGLFLVEIGWPQSTYGRLGYYGICVVKPFGRPARPACVPWTDGWSGREIAHRLSLHNRLNFNGTEYYDRFGSHIDLAARLQRDTFFPSLLIAGCLVFVLAFFLTTTSIYSRSLQPTVRKITAVIAKISALAAALLFLLTASFSQAVVIGESSILGTTTFVQPGLALLVMQWITAILAGFFAGLVPAAIESGIKETREGFFHLHIEDTNCQDDMS